MLIRNIIIVAVLSLVSCTQIDSPDEVAREFWEAMEDKDIEQAGKYAVPGSMEGYSSENIPDIELIAVSGKPEIREARALAGTEIKMKTDRKTGIYKFDTVLLNINNEWKVDYDRTLNSLMMASVKEFGEELKRMGREMGKALGEAMKEMGEAMEEAFNGAHDKFRGNGSDETR